VAIAWPLARRICRGRKETWPADDEVVLDLDGPVGPSVATGEGLTLERIVGDGTVRSGSYRFTR
jgi:hypothetical protein